MMPRSLSARLMLAAMFGLFVAAAVAGVLTALTLWPRATTPMLREELDEEVEHVWHGLRDGGGAPLTVVLRAKNASVYDAMPKDAAYLVLDRERRIVAHSAAGPALDVLRAMRGDERTRTIANGELPLQLQLTERTFEVDGRCYTIRVARSDRLVTTLKDYAGELYARAGSVALLLALGTFAAVVFLTTRRVLLPVRTASRAASRIGPRNLTARLQVEDVPAELLPLIDAFNAALSRLEKGYRVQQEFLAAAAHELKTPLALLRAEVELGGAGNVDVLLRDIEGMARQVHQLLHLAEVSEGHNYAFAEADIGAVVAEAMDYLRRLSHRQSVYLALERDEDRPLRADADRAAVFMLAKNLLENAIHHAPPHSVVLVRVDASGFSVTDEGPGVAAADRSRLFQRFWRGPAREGKGAGLGLAICEEICVAHGWRVDLRQGSRASGACFVVTVAATSAAR